jgi:antitoxin (DNA-binding transcriptional repressor) of toxin-antitoxin stability system
MGEIDRARVIEVSIEQMAQHLPAYLHLVEEGETLLIVKAGKPMAEVKPVISDGTALRPFGLSAGKFTVPDDFDAPLPEDVLREFEAA